ncbi:MAG TPA: class I SAM-dependent methyltransferase [Acidimicrobiales bacterium]|nr:class I SAM-dependent methyltransferase [Acidimicrobiales bacterium]
MENEAHALEWTDSTIARFWRHEQHFPEHSFSSKYGSAIISHFSAYLAKGSRVLDFGSGPGYLTTLLARRGCRVWATDVLEEARSATCARNIDVHGFMGCLPPSSLQKHEGYFDCIVAVEIIEHLTDAAFDEFWLTAHSLLRASGTLFITTPNAENLEKKSVYCPGCGHTFHRWQHVRSVTVELLIDVAEKYGFRPVSVGTVDFRRSTSLWNWLIKRVNIRRGSTSEPHLYAVLAAIP